MSHRGSVGSDDNGHTTVVALRGFSPGSEVGLAPELHGDEGTGTEEAGFHGYALDGGRIL